jgi:hypothetical protein
MNKTSVRADKAHVHGMQGSRSIHPLKGLARCQKAKDIQTLHRGQFCPVVASASSRLEQRMTKLSR